MTDAFVRCDVYNGIGTVTMQRAPANAVDIEFAKQLADGLEQLEIDDGVRSIVLTGSGNFFSAGLDLKLIPKYDRKQQQTMVRELGRAIYALYGSRKPTVAAVNGHAVAAGTLFTLCCDYRIGLHGDFRFGLTGARVAVPYPIAAREVIEAELGQSGSRIALLGAKTFDSETALRLGILDETVDGTRLMNHAKDVSVDRASMPGDYYGELKNQLRASSLARIKASLDGDPALDRWIPETG